MRMAPERLLESRPSRASSGRDVGSNSTSPVTGEEAQDQEHDRDDEKPLQALNEETHSSEDESQQEQE